MVPLPKKGTYATVLKISVALGTNVTGDTD